MRESGILMPMFSLDGKYGIGGMGNAAQAFVDFLQKYGFKLWQVLPKSDERRKLALSISLFIRRQSVLHRFRRIA